MIKRYSDSSLLANPLLKYSAWLSSKIYYQLKYWGCHLRIDYNACVRNVTFGKYNTIGQNVILAGCSMDDFSYIAYGAVITHATIGKFCSIGPNVKIAPGRHPTGVFVSTHPALFSNPAFLRAGFTNKTHYQGNVPVVIGNDVWIGADCVILDGVTIGDGAIIAANSVVTKDVEPYCLVGGSPARFIKKRFDDHQEELLLKVRWWDKSEQWIRNNCHLFWDINVFYDFFKGQQL